MITIRRNEAEWNFMKMIMRQTPFNVQVRTEECIMRDSAITLVTFFIVIVDLINSELQTRIDTQ